MKVTAASVVLAALGSGIVEARPQAPKNDFVIQASQFGPEQLRASSAPAAMSMATLRGMKTDYRQQQRDAGVYKRDKYERAGPIPCVDGKAGEYACGRVDLMDFLPHQETGSTALEGNDIWGWTASNGREFGAVAQVDGTSFVEVLKDGKLSYLGFLPTQTENSVWRDIKSIGNHIYIGSEAPGHGLQIFDMRKLLTVDPASPVVFPLSALTAHFDGFGSSHNVVANEETQMIYVVGTDTTLSCRGGLWMIDVSNPARPQDYGCVSSDGYVHDAQCVIYRGPHAAYRNQEICFNYNEDALTIVDVTRKTRPRQLSRTTYQGATYTHQGWLADAGMRYLLLDDELDESNRNGPAADGRTATYVVDVSDLTWPVFTSVYKSPAKSIDHNQYVIDGVSYQSNYGSGLRVVDVRSVVAANGSSDGFMQGGFFDCRPEDDAVGGETTFDGAWSVYPYFKSGYILLNSIERGVFSLKYHG